MQMSSKVNLLIGIPKMLPVDDLYTTSAQVWANMEVCRQVFGMLSALLPEASIKIGPANSSDPSIRLLGISIGAEERKLLSLARSVAKAAVEEVAKRIEGNLLIPRGLRLIRTLNVLKVEHFGGLIEYRLELEELSPAQSADLSDRDWAVVGDAAAVSCLVDRYEREREWLVANDVILN